MTGRKQQEMQHIVIQKNPQNSQRILKDTKVDYSDRKFDMKIMLQICMPYITQRLITIWATHENWSFSESGTSKYNIVLPIIY